MFPTRVSRALVLCLVAAVITAGSPPPPPPPPVVFGFRWSTTHSDGMVLQADPQRSIVWGFSATAVKVCVQSKPAVASRPPPCNYSVKDGKVWFRIELTKAVLKDDASTLRFHRVMTTRRTTITLLPSMYADARHIDAVIVSQAASSTCTDSVMTPGPAPGIQIFTATLPPMKPSATPYDVTATQAGDGDAIYLRGVLFGDVFVCSGQSK